MLVITGFMKTCLLELCFACIHKMVMIEKWKESKWSSRLKLHSVNEPNKKILSDKKTKSKTGNIMQPTYNFFP